MRTSLLLLIFSVTSLHVFSQQNVPYAEKAMQIQKDVWGAGVPEFKVTTVPAAMNNESAVILARSFSLQRTSKPRVKFMVLGTAVATRTVKLSTFHERVKINDKTALDEFSTLEYQKKLDKTTSFLFNKVVNVADTYIGVKILKPNGTETIVNTGEEVLLQNSKKDEEGKLAIPGLQVGDILDYYISNVNMTETENGYRDNDNLFLLGDEHPILYYNLDFQFSKKINVQFICANGAPKFEEHYNQNADRELSMQMKDLPKYQGELWTSPLREYPYVEVGSTSEGDGNNSRFEAVKSGFESLFVEFSGYDQELVKTKEFFDGRKNMKNAPVDSVVKVLYDEWKFNVFCQYEGDELQHLDEMNYRVAQSRRAVVLMSIMLTNMDIANNVLLVAPRTANTLQNAYNPEDVDAMILINSPTPVYLCFDDIVTHFNEIPSRYQGEMAVELFPARHNMGQHYTFNESEVTLPVISPDKNVEEETLQVSLLAANLQKLQVKRVVKEQGALRHGDQKLLLPVADIDEGLRTLVKGADLAKRLKSHPVTKKMVDDYTFSFSKEKTDMSRYFTSEIKSQFDQDPEQVQDTKVVDPAMEDTDPVFQYTESFVLNNMVKKAGLNYIIDAGKLTGSFYKLEEKERKRSLDVYMLCARTFKYTIAIAIPPGYGVKGMEEMTVKKANKTGSFSSSAVVAGNVLTITVNRIYNSNFEKASDWPAVMELVDAASNFNSQKILLEKKG